MSRTVVHTNDSIYLTSTLQHTGHHELLCVNYKEEVESRSEEYDQKYYLKLT